MNRRSLIWGSLALVLVAGGATAQALSAGADEQAVIAAEQQWLKALQTNNVELLAPLLADKIVETSEQGKVFGKDAVLAIARSETWSSARYTDLNVTVFSHTAIATGAFIGNGKDASGRPLDARVRFTDTWVKMADGKWLCVANHNSLLVLDRPAV